MEIEYSSEEVKNQCESVKAAKKLFGGDVQLVSKLMSRVEALAAAETLKDIVVQKQFRFHKLENKGKKRLEGYYAIDVKTKKEPWRIILRPMRENGQAYDSFNVDELADKVEFVEIREVSNHYE